MIQPVDSSILHEIARVVNTRSKVPDRVRIRGKEYQLTYLDDHKQRIEDAIRRHDPDRLNMLYGQLASKVKYQLLRQTAARRAARSTAKGASATSKRKSQSGKKRGTPKKPALGKRRTLSRAGRR